MNMTAVAIYLMVFLWRSALAIPSYYKFQQEYHTGTTNNIHKKGGFNIFKRSVLKRPWPKPTIPYKISNYFSEVDKKRFVAALNSIEDMTRHDGKNCLRFVNQTDEEIYIQFSNATGCGSYVGYQGNVQNIYLAEICRSFGIIVHEILHSLGFYHEQSRPDRDDFIELNITNIRKHRRPNFKKVNPSATTIDLPYDYHSIMHYHNNAFAIDYRYRTIITKVKGVRIGQRIGMSQLDIKKLQRLYGCEERHLVVPQHGNILSPNCTFDNGLCGWTQVKISSPLNANKWVRHSFFTFPNTGPTYDHTYRTFEGFYLYTKAASNLNTVARIQTPQLSPGNYCLTFWYQIYGSLMASLTVNKIDEDNISSGLFSTKGNRNQGNKWIEVNVSITSTATIKIEFEGKIANIFSISIAVDDVIFLPGLC